MPEDEMSREFVPKSQDSAVSASATSRKDEQQDEIERRLRPPLTPEGDRTIRPASSPSQRRPSSQATTVSYETTPEHTLHEVRNMPPGYEEMIRHERELEEIKSPGSDYITTFERLVKDSIPELGAIRRNEVGLRPCTSDLGERVSYITDDESPTRPGIAPKAKRRVTRGKLRKNLTDIDQREEDSAFRPPPSKRTTSRAMRGKRGNADLKRKSTTEELKRRRPSMEDAPTVRREEERFFQGQTFFWLPNDEKLLGRKLRMQRAKEWGSERATAFSPQITHLIVEENFDYRHALGQLGIDRVPDNIVVVNEKYIPACIAIRRLVNPSADRFRVKGHQESLDAEKASRAGNNPTLTIEFDDEHSQELPVIVTSPPPPEPAQISSQTIQPARSSSQAARPVRFSSQTIQSGSAANEVRSDSPILHTDDYEVPDSQPDVLPGSPVKSSIQPPPRKRNAAFLQSLDIKHYSRDTLSSSPSSSNDPSRRLVFQTERQVPMKPFIPNWEGPTGRKNTQTPPPKDDHTPFVTPALTSPSYSTTTGLGEARDELDILVAETKAKISASSSSQLGHSGNVTDLLDEESSDDSQPSNTSPPSGDKTRKTMPPTSWQDKFTCMHPNEQAFSDTNPNAKVISVLQEMSDHFEIINDHWRATAYRKAIGALKRQTIAVTTAEQARQVNGIGGKMAEKIAEIHQQGNLHQLELIKQDVDYEDAVLKTFTQIYGVGVRQASKWIAQGFRTLEDLRDKANLTESQSIGLEHFHDFQQRIARAEIDMHAEVVNRMCVEVSWKLKAIVGGSYRRGAEESGDIDFLVTSTDDKMPDHILHDLVFKTLIPRLFEAGYLKARLAGRQSEESTMWHGAALLPSPSLMSSSEKESELSPSVAKDTNAPSTSSSPSPWRRVDILMVPRREWGAASIYFTGNDIFNRSVRLLARKKGYRLNQHGLYRNVLRDAGGRKHTGGTLVEGGDERRIFEILGVPYRPPSQRNC